MSTANELLNGPKVINAGLRSFTETLREQNIPVVQLDWHTPAGGDTVLLKKLDETLD